ncbi:MAG: DUF3192 domain-containing protein [Pseudomonadales bacterium]
MVLAVLFLSGCYISVRDDGPEGGWQEDGGDWQLRQQRNREAIGYLELGRGIDSLMAELGTPDLTESFLRDGRQFRVLFYRTRLAREDGLTSRDETTPLVFVDGELVGWGESAIAHALP